MDYAIGCDISRWQDKLDTPEQVDFTKMMSAGASFVFLKASQTTWKDRTFDYHWQASQEAGLLRGAYHFMTWSDPIAQADYFSNLLRDDPGELPPIADFEWWKTTPPNAAGLLAQFIAQVERNLGIVPGIYTAPGYWNPHGSKNAFFARSPLWIAWWIRGWRSWVPGNWTPKPPKPWSTWEFWQFTNKGDGAAHGVESDQIDMNRYNGTLDELIAKYGGGAVAPVETTNEEKVDILWQHHPSLH